MDSTEVSGSNKASDSWSSAEQEIGALVEEFISQDVVSAEIKQKAERLHEAGDSHKALRVILDSLD
ncbi:hypothetical protein GOC83_19050 [Haloarcula rubripromontorii]|uniref:Uncharacterized protein n=1 Tax=Haloarcula rubripromontorii TaxID=1705562 RepID=A0A847UBJ2_9EURY|nr:hypothetical protein [Haloarcula rubripromontorii]NLV08221.1 hypothetical protein [Haloarcula rubripromontorii]